MRCGEAWRGEARITYSSSIQQGMAWKGNVGYGSARNGRVWLVAVRWGKARLGMEIECLDIES